MEGTPLPRVAPPVSGSRERRPRRPPQAAVPRAWLSAAAVVSILMAGACHGAAVGWRLALRADPDRVPADGRSAIAISVEVTDAFGRPAPDGTVVHVASTMGEVVSPVQTIGGLAQTVLTAPAAAGTALVSAIVGGSRQSLQVEFLAEPGSAAPGSRLVELAAEELAYSAEHRVFVATWKAELRYREVEIRADGIQYDMTAGVVCAQGSVVLRARDQVVQADALRYELLTLRGRLVRLGPEPERLVVVGEKLETQPDPAEDPALWDPLGTGDTRTWVKARRAVVDPGQKIILDHATFYVDDTRVMSLRRHVMDPATGGAVFGRALGFSSASGVSLDLPWYYHAGASRVGSLHLTRNRTFARGRAEPGWALGMREEYSRQGRTEGALELDDLLHPDQGVRWEHRQRLGSGAALSLDASSLAFTAEDPRLRSGSISLSQPLAEGRLSLITSRSDFGASEHSLSELEYRFAGRRAAGGVLITPAARLRYSRTQVDTEALVFDPETGEPIEISEQSTGRLFSPGVDLNLSLATRELGNQFRLNGGMTAGWAWGLPGGAGGLLDGRVVVDRRLRAGGTVGLSFSYSSGRSDVGTSLFRSGRQLLTLGGQTVWQGASLRLSLSRDLAADRQFGSLHLGRALPFGRDVLGRPLWKLDLSHVFSRVAELSAVNSRLALSRALGRYQLSLCYSPQGVGDYGSRPWVSPFGYGYTYSGGRHLWLELTAREY